MRSSAFPFEKVSVLPLLLSILLLLVRPAFSQSKECPAGHFFNTTASRCEPCPTGTYRSSRFFEPKTKCHKCRAGTFNPYRGVVSEDVCRLCYEDTFSEAGAAKCKKCPSGTIANRGSTTCLTCGPGFAASSFSDYAVSLWNPSKCVPCRTGSYSDQPNNRECKPCPDYMTSPKQATSRTQCSACPPGRQAFLGSGGCLRCAAGSFKSGIAGECRACPRGTFAPKNGATSCKPCPKGMRPAHSQEKCIPCPPGTTTKAKGARICNPIGFRCRSAFFETKYGDCNRCEEGYKYNAKEKTCEKCPPGAVSRGGLQRVCKICPPGQSPDHFKNECRCREGEQLGSDGKCERCPKGTFSNNDYEGSEGCVKCEPGTFADKRGSLICKSCPQGTIASRKGSVRCKRCPQGLVPNIPLSSLEEEAIGCVLPTTGCPIGWARQELGATYGPISGCSRVSCRVDTPKEDIGKVCLPCEAGWALNEKGTRCKRCARDEVSDGGIISSCTKCKDGLRQDLRNPSKCSCFQHGHGFQDGMCKPCPKGSFNSGRSEVCEKCARGCFSNRRGSTYCMSCAQNTIASKVGMRKCTRCPKGQISNKFTEGTRCIGK